MKCEGESRPLAVCGRESRPSETPCRTSRRSHRPLADDDSAKRRQIIEGARAVFLAQGFDAASMNDIARKAGVSKGTLYVYFRNKEELFEAITEEQCRMQAERVFVLDRADHDVAAVLTRLGSAFATLHLQPLDLADPHRDRDRGPHARDRAAVLRDGPRGRYREVVDLSARAGRGRRTGYRRRRIATSSPDSFSNHASPSTFKPVLFNFAPPPPQERIDHVVGIAVRAFMKAYGKRLAASKAGTRAAVTHALRGEITPASRPA